jgi:hypothetical protein
MVLCVISKFFCCFLSQWSSMLLNFYRFKSLCYYFYAMSLVMKFVNQHNDEMEKVEMNI